jgi:hypothetical protein
MDTSFWHCPGVRNLVEPINIHLGMESNSEGRIHTPYIVGSDISSTEADGK